MTIFSTGQWVDTMFTFLYLDNGVVVQLTTVAGSGGATFIAKDDRTNTDITRDITKMYGEGATSSADTLIHWLELARKWQPMERTLADLIGEKEE